MNIAFVKIHHLFYWRKRRDYDDEYTKNIPHIKTRDAFANVVIKIVVETGMRQRGGFVRYYNR